MEKQQLLRDYPRPDYSNEDEWKFVVDKYKKRRGIPPDQDIIPSDSRKEPQFLDWLYKKQ